MSGGMFQVASSWTTDKCGFNGQTRMPRVSLIRCCPLSFSAPAPEFRAPGGVFVGTDFGRGLIIHVYPQVYNLCQRFTCNTHHNCSHSLKHSRTQETHPHPSTHFRVVFHTNVIPNHPPTSFRATPPNPRISSRTRAYNSSARNCLSV